MTRALLASGLLALAAGCHSPAYGSAVFHPWGCDNAAELRDQFQECRNVLMVCIYEDHWEDRGPNRYSLHHLKGTVVRAYKGDWRVSEQIALVQSLDDRAPANPPSAAGSLGFVFTSEHRDTEIGLDTGEFHRYDAEYAPALECAYR